MCLWLYSRISPSFSSTWFQYFGPSGNPWKEYFALVRSWQNACSLPWWLCERVEGASKGFVLRCVFETFQIKPVDPLIVRLEGFFSLRFGFSRLNKKLRLRIRGLEDRGTTYFYCPGPSRPIGHSSLWKRHRRIERRKTILKNSFLSGLCQIVQNCTMT